MIYFSDAVLFSFESIKLPFKEREKKKKKEEDKNIMLA